jgi:5-methyltetrahydropteroyltriglutamate--homocysteine methyltransferase
MAHRPLLGVAQRDATLAACVAEKPGSTSSPTAIRREITNRFANALDGLDPEHPGSALSRTGRPTPVPRVIGPIRRLRPVEVEDLKFLRAHTRRLAKITVPGPFTMTQLAQNEYYPDELSLAMAYAQAVNEEIRDLFAAGADIVQIDEPYMQAQPEKARRYAVTAINRALEGISGATSCAVLRLRGSVRADKTVAIFLDDLRGCICRQVSSKPQPARSKPRARQQAGPASVIGRTT